LIDAGPFEKLDSVIAACLTRVRFVHTNECGRGMMGKALSIVKRVVSIVIAIALVMAGIKIFQTLSLGGALMTECRSQGGNSVAEYYYQAWGTCMQGFAYFAAALLWALAWIIAAWPDNQGIIGALTDKTPDSRTRASAGCAAVETSLSSQEEKTPTGGTGEQSS
jgi:hypothetical protein